MDTLINLVDNALRTVFAPHRPARDIPHADLQAAGIQPLSDAEKKLSGAYMRVNHVGEVCAQALYAAQAHATQDRALKQHLMRASAEETDHLAWTEHRLKELGEHRSYLNPLWYAGAFSIGYLAAKIGGDKVSLGFVVETERQVEAHLESHLSKLPANDVASKAIVMQMKKDEAQHAIDAQKAGAVELPKIASECMRLASKVMTTVAHRV